MAASDANKLVDDLSSADYDTRISAEQRLADAGEAARAALEKAAQSSDQEVQAAAARLLAMLKRATVLFLAFDRDGKPAAGAGGEIVVSSPTVANNGVEVKPIPVLFDEKGEFRIPNQPPGPTNFNFTFKDWTSSSYGYVLNLKPGLNPQVMILCKGSNISGQVVDQAGNPVKDATVIIAPNAFDADGVAAESSWPAMAAGMMIDQTGMGVFTGQTDAEGKYKIDHLPNGVYFTMARADGFVSGVGKAVRVRELDSITAAPVKLQALKRGKLEIKLETAPDKPLMKRNVLVYLTPIFEGADAERRRAIYARIGMNQNEGAGYLQAATDANGKFTLDNLNEGAYRLLILPNTDDPAVAEEEGAADGDVVAAHHEYVQERLEVKSGDAAAACTLQPASIGALSGAVAGLAGNNAVAIQMVQERDLQSILLTLGAVTDFSSSPGVKYGTASAPVGEFHIAQLREGRYAMLLRDNLNRLVIVYGIEIKAGQTVAAPEIKWEAPKEADLGPMIVKGKVLDPDRKPFPNASVAMAYASGSWGSSTNAEGGFEFNLQNLNLQNLQEAKKNIKLVVRVAGYRTVHMPVDNAGNVDLEVVLERRRYGEISVMVDDEAGKPLQGAVVSAIYQPGSYSPYGNAQRTEATNSSGRAHFRRIGDGPRKMGVFLDGYYLDKPLEVTIKPDVSQEVKAVLRKGLQLNGTVEVPPDFKGPVQVEITSKLVTSPLSVLVQDGKFSYDGLMPGEYTINPTAIGCCLAAPVKVKLELGPKPVPVALKLIRGSTLAFAVPAELSGRNLQLFDPQKWNKPECVIDGWHKGGSGYADGEGRLEEWNTLPGEYVVGCLPPIENVYRYNQKETVATNILGRVLAQKSVPAAKTGSVEAPLLKPAPATARVKYKLQRESVSVYNRMAQRGWYLNPMVVLIGERATATQYAYYTEQEGAAPRILGTPPPGLIPPDPRVYSISALPSGEYKLYWIAHWNNYYERERAPQPVLLKTFTVTDGETLDLGEMKVPALPPPPEAASAAAVEDSIESDSEAPKFQP